MAPEKKPPVEDIKTPKPQRRLIKKKRAGMVLNRDEVKQIKKGRKKLRKDMKAAGIKSKKEFELTASSLMLYFDKPKFLALIPWLFSGRGLAMLLASFAVLLFATWAVSQIANQRGYFTINLSDDMFREGFSLSETITFDAPSMRLFAEPAVDVPAVSFNDIASDVNMVDGRYEGANYFAYTFYIRNEGENTVDYSWQVRLNSETKQLSDAVWVMVFEDDVMSFYAKPRADGTAEVLPTMDDTRNWFYKEHPLFQYVAQPEEQLQLIAETEISNYYRLVPFTFESEDVITSGGQKDVAPMDVHKYTVVIWLEGDDPECKNDKIGGHAGLEMHFQLEEDEPDSFGSKWNEFWSFLT